MYANNSINLYETVTCNLITKINVGRWENTCINYSPDGTIIALIGSQYPSLINLINLYDSQNGKLILSINTLDIAIQTAIFSPDGKYLLAGANKMGGIKSYLHIYNLETGNLIRKIEAHNSPLTKLRFSFDGKYLASSSNLVIFNKNRDSTTKVWFVCQKDTSSLVTIQKANIFGKDVNMGTIETNTQKDSLVSACIVNLSDLPVHINDIKLTGSNSNQFEMLTNLPFDILANGSYPVQFRFKPNSTGFKKADLQIIYQENDTLTQSIWGTATGFDVQKNKIDFGTICNKTKKDTINVFAIKNNSTIPINVKKLSLIDINSNFSLLSNTNTFTLNIGQSYNVDLSYLPKIIGSHSATIQFDILEKDTSIFVEIFGNSIELKTKILASNINFCSGSSVVLSANPKLLNVSYLWSNGSNDEEIIVNKSGKYWLYSLLDGKCEARDTIEVFENPIPKVSILGENTICSNKSVTLTSDNDFKSYNWSTGETTKSILITKAGEYKLNVIDLNGCTASASHTISQNTLIFSIYPSELNHSEIEIGESSEIKLKIENQNNLSLNIERIYYSSNNKDIANNQSIGTYEISDIFIPSELKDYQDTINIKINQPCDTTLQVITSGVGIAYSTVYAPKLETIPGANDFEIPILKKQSKDYGNIKSEYVAKVAIDYGFFKPTNISTTIINKDIISSISGTLTGIKDETLYTLKGNVYFANGDKTPIKITELIPNNPRWKILKEDGELKLKGVCAKEIRKIEINPILLEILPNPVKDKLIINFKGYEDNEPITILNIVGTNLIETTIKESIDVSNLSSGLYFFKIRNQVYKFVKE